MNIVEIKKNSTCVIQHCRGPYASNLSFGLKNVNSLSIVSFIKTVVFDIGAKCFMVVNCVSVYHHGEYVSTGVVV